MAVTRRFENQVAVVTGAASGIGRAVAQRLADEGATVALLDLDADAVRHTAEAMTATGAAVEPVQVDVSDDAAVRHAVQRVCDRWGRLDVAVHCAGIVGPNGRPVTDVSVEEFDRVYRVNLRGSFLLLKHVLPPMRQRDYGRVLLVASIAGKEGNAGMCAYSATKAGVIGLVKSVGKELAQTRITVNALAPAVVRTALVEAMDPAQVAYMTDRIPMKRCGTLDEVAATACWAVSPEASFTTGFTFDVSGGRAVY